MNQAQRKSGEWIEVEERIDGIYANGIRIANVFGEIENDEFKKIELISL